MSIKITGTSHIKPISEKDTFDFIALELDRYRFHALTNRTKSRFNWADASKIGFGGYLFAYFGGLMQNYLAKKLGVAPGEDMLSAIKLANKTNARLVLIDRPIQITLQRFSKNISVLEKLKFVCFLIISMLFVREKISLNEIPTANAVNKLLKELQQKFPGIYRVLVKERDEYMAHKLIILQQQFPEAKILVIVGAGHLTGLKTLLETHL